MTRKKQPKVLDIEARKELKSTKEVLDISVDNLHNSTHIIDQLNRENLELKEKVAHLEELLKHTSSVPDLERKPHEEEIIQVELKRMWDTHVINNVPLVDKDDVKKLETLVKCLVSLRAGKPVKVKKEKTMSIEDALRIVKDDVS